MTSRATTRPTTAPAPGAPGRRRVAGDRHRGRADQGPGTSRQDSDRDGGADGGQDVVIQLPDVAAPIQPPADTEVETAAAEPGIAAAEPGIVAAEPGTAADATDATDRAEDGAPRAVRPSSRSSWRPAWWPSSRPARWRR